MSESAQTLSTSTLLQDTEGGEGSQGEEKSKSVIGPDGKRRGRGFTSESARRALVTRSEKAAERKKAAEERALTAGLTARQKLGLGIAQLSQERIDRIIDNLATQAEQGDVKSIHALARLLDQSFGRAREEAAPDGRETFEKQWQDWSPAEKATYRAALLAQHAREQAEQQPAGDEADPRGEAQ